MWDTGSLSTRLRPTLCQYFSVHLYYCPAAAGSNYHKPWGLTQCKFLVSQCQGPEVWNPGLSRATLPQKSLRENAFPALPSFWGLWPSWASDCTPSSPCLHITAPWSGLWQHHSHLSLPVFIGGVFASLCLYTCCLPKGTSVMPTLGRGKWLTLLQFHLIFMNSVRTYFKGAHILRCWELGLQLTIRWDTIQPQAATELVAAATFLGPPILPHSFASVYPVLEPSP